MTRASKSYNSTPKEPKEPKLERKKRLENYRIAKTQAKKFVIPGIVAVFACLFLLFGTLYGFKGSKLQTRERRPEDLIFDKSAIPADLGKDLEKESTKAKLTQEILDALSKVAPMEEIPVGEADGDEAAGKLV